MPRDSSGNYTLPLGNPVVPSTLIDTTWANTTLNDIALQLNGVVTRDGKLGPTAPLKLLDGSEPLPSLAFVNAASTGMWRSATNLGFSWGGTTYLNINATEVGVVNALRSPLITCGAPALYAEMGTNAPNATGYFKGHPDIDFFVGSYGATRYMSMKSTRTLLALPDAAEFSDLPCFFTAKGSLGAATTDLTKIIQLSADSSSLWSKGDFNIHIFDVANPSITFLNVDGSIALNLKATYLGVGEVGWRNCPDATGNTPVTADAGKTIYANGTVNLNNGVFAFKDKITIVNMLNTSITVNGPTTFYTSGTTTSGAKTLDANGIAVVIFQSSTQAIYAAL